MSALVSIVLPVYNGAPFLRETLDSIYAQTYEPFELIVVDDGSTDESVEIIETYEPLLLLRQSNQGASAARNTGIAEARGEYLAFVDADDIVPPSKLADQVGYLEAHPDVAATLGRQEWLNPPPGLARDVVWGDLDGVPIMSMVVRRHVFAELAGMDEDKGGDLDFLVRMRERGLSFVVLPEIVLIRRYHGGNLVAGRALSPLPAISLKEKLDRERARRREGADG